MPALQPQPQIKWKVLRKINCNSQTWNQRWYRATFSYSTSLYNGINFNTDYENTKSNLCLISSGLTLNNGFIVFVLLDQMNCSRLAKVHAIRKYRGSLACQLVQRYWSVAKTQNNTFTIRTPQFRLIQTFIWLTNLKGHHQFKSPALREKPCSLQEAWD